PFWQIEIYRRFSTSRLPNERRQRRGLWSIPVIQEDPDLLVLIWTSSRVDRPQKRLPGWEQMKQILPPMTQCARQPQALLTSERITGHLAQHHIQLLHPARCGFLHKCLV